MSFPRRSRTTLPLAVLLALGTAMRAAAQTDPGRPLPSSFLRTSELIVAPAMPDDSSEARVIAVRDWTQAYQEWKAWFARWHNRREPGFFSAKPRRQPPEPPAWMQRACGNLVEDEGTLAEGCEAWREWQRNDYVALVRSTQVTQTRDDLEKPRKTVWWEHVHLDALWPMTQSGASAFGVVGAHVTLNVSKRVQVFLAPGAILMRLPTGDGSQSWSLATDWGFSYRMFDFRLPGMGRPSTLHLNLARVWVLGTTNLPVERELYLAGFSLTFKQRPGASGGR